MGYADLSNGHLYGSGFSWPVWLARTSRLVPYLAPVGESDAHDAAHPGRRRRGGGGLLDVAGSLGSGHRRPPRHLQLSDHDHGWVEATRPAYGRPQLTDQHV
ncbi:MAG: hypothetical protein ACRDRO_30825 [Pseudonocardiaceae bacterium]